MTFLPRIILVRPSHPGNIGSVARSMKVMGLTSLTLVSPKKFPDEEATALSAHAEDILENAVVVNNLVDALKDISFVYATSANPRSVDLPVFNPKEAVLNMQSQKEHRIAILFGPENYGLDNKDLLYAHALIHIPTSESYRSLNLASAVQIIAYEYLMMSNEKKDFVNMAEMENFYEALEKIFIEIKFLDPNQPGNLMPKLRGLFNRAHLDQSEINILMGFLKAVKNK
jgi:tRNA (cytidine32/uridine32-2'-O)-methyltransferase